MQRALAVFILALLAVTASAETRYVSDELEITLRQGESTSHRISAMLKSGTAVEVLGTNKATGYSRVKTPGDIRMPPSASLSRIRNLSPSSWSGDQLVHWGRDPPRPPPGLPVRANSVQ